MADVTEIAEQLSTLTVMEAASLAKLLEEKWGVTAAAPVAVAAAPGAGGGAVAAEEQTEFDVILLSAGDKKIQVCSGRENPRPACFWCRRSAPES
jgi:large subunit ribosomal protein L7/L12